MKTLDELTRNAVAAARNRDRIIKPLGTFNGWLFFSALPKGFESGSKTGLPYAYCANLATGESRFCTIEESDMLTEQDLGPIPD